MAEYKMRVKNSDPELSSVLYYPPALALFEAFSIKEIATESLFFWKAVEYFDDLCERLDRLVEKQKERAAAGSSSSGAAAASGAMPTIEERRSSAGRRGGSSGGKVRWQPAQESGPMQLKRQLATGIAQLRDMCTSIMKEYVFQGSLQQVHGLRSLGKCILVF
jgi:hypothetical protein